MALTSSYVGSYRDNAIGPQGVRQSATWGVGQEVWILRSQLERYIVEELGPDYLASRRNKTELRMIKKEMADLKKRLDQLQARKKQLEEQLEE